MFESVLIDFRRAASGLVISYLGRAVVAVPFIAAAGFATAALTLFLIDQYGAQMAYWLLAGGFTLIGVIGAAIVSLKEQEAEQPIVEEKAEQNESGPLSVAEGALAPIAAALIPLLTSPLGFGGTFKVGKWALRNTPLIVLAAVLTMLFWPTGRSAVEEMTGESSPEPGLSPAE